MESPETLATLGKRHITLEKTVEGPVFLDCPFIIALYGFL
jgi:hypothetical protein